MGVHQKLLCLPVHTNHTKESGRDEKREEKEEVIIRSCLRLGHLLRLRFWNRWSRSWWRDDCRSGYNRISGAIDDTLGIRLCGSLRAIIEDIHISDGEFEESKSSAARDIRLIESLARSYLGVEYANRLAWNELKFLVTRVNRRLRPEDIRTIFPKRCRIGWIRYEARARSSEAHHSRE